MLVLVRSVLLTPRSAVYQVISEHFMLLSADNMEMLISFSKRTWHLGKSTITYLNDYDFIVLTDQENVTPYIIYEHTQEKDSVHKRKKGNFKAVFASLMPPPLISH